MTSVLKRFGFILVLIILIGITACNSLEDERPNIIVLLADDLASWAVGYNNPDFLTPQIDKLASQGVVFNQHFNTTPICMASRASLMTGMYEYKTGTNFSHGDMSADIFSKSYPVLLRKSGYFTGFIGKFGFLTPPNKTADLPKGYDKLPVDRFSWWAGGIGQTHYKTADNHFIRQYANEYPHCSAANGAAAVDFIKQAKKSGKPFCLSVSFKAPHLPDTPDPQFNDIFKNRTYKKPENYWRENGQHLPLQAKIGRQYLSPKRYGFYPENFQKRMASYNQLIYGIDNAIGMIREALKEQGMEENTIIIFTSDNGYFNGNHGLSCKVLPYEESANAPLVIYNPLNKKHFNADLLTGNVDIAPTILSYASVDIPENIDGKNIRKVFDNPEVQFRNSLPVINTWGPISAQYMAIVSLDYKYVFWPFGEGVEPAEELYDRHADPYEMKNLALGEGYPDKLNHYRDTYDMRLIHWQKAGINKNGYELYPSIFNRDIPWEDKKEFVDKTFINEYQKFYQLYQKDTLTFEHEFGIKIPKLQL